MNPLNITLYYSRRNGREVFIESMGRTARGLGIEVTIQGVDESGLELGVLENHQPLPEGSIVITHGNVADYHRNIERIRQLSLKRGDIRCVVACDENYLYREKFVSDAQWEYARSKIAEEFAPTNPVIVITHTLPSFLTGRDDDEDQPVQKSFRNYLRLFQEFRGGA